MDDVDERDRAEPTMEPRKGRVTRIPPEHERVRRGVVYHVSARPRGLQGFLAALVAIAIVAGVFVLGLLTAVVALWIALGVVAVAALVAIVRALTGRGPR